MRPPDIRLFSSDLDGTLLGDPEGTRRFAQLWAGLPVGIRPLLVYNTARTVADTQMTVQTRGLPEPDYIIGSLGTELHDSLYKRAREYRREIGPTWNPRVVDEIVGATPGIRKQPGDQAPYKSSWYWEKARTEEVDALRRRIVDAGVTAKVIYSCRYFLDVIPAGTGKGAALAWLAERLGIPHARVLVAGDTGNDSDMFLLPGVMGILVANALPELLGVASRKAVYVARAPMADGVIEGLRHFGVLTPADLSAGMTN